MAAADRSRTIVVAGAGVAGLTLALALAKFGVSVVVLERNDRIQEFGAGLQISPNARHALNRLGLDRAVTGKSFVPEGLDVYPYRWRKPLQTLRFGSAFAERYSAPYAVMHRADLVEVLHGACKRFANIDIVFGVKRFDLEAHARGLTVNVEEKGGAHRIMRPFAFVGADGVHSRTRTRFLGGPEAQYSGYVAWRTLVAPETLAPVLSLQSTSLLAAGGFHTVVYPLPHRNMVNVVVLARMREKHAFADTPPDHPRIGGASVLDRKLHTIMEAAKDSWTFWPLAAVNTQAWHRGPVGILGDAAHAMLPFQAQGAAMAIEDATILAPLLVTEPTAESAFAHFAALRQPRIAKVARISRRNGHIFHMRWPFTLARDLAIRAGGETSHLRRLDWLYSYDPTPEVAPKPLRARKVVARRQG